MPDILWQDDRILAINKPSGLATIPGRDEDDCVIARFTSAGTPVRVVHRLDKWTSGVLLLAKDRDAQRSLCRQFLARKVEKEYFAMVQGWPQEDSGQIDAPLERHSNTAKLMAVAKHGREAITRWEVAQRFRSLTLLKCFPKTGRMHQVRVHLRSIGLPLAVDPLYNPAPPGQTAGIFLSDFKRDYRFKKTEERPLIGRLTLHAAKINFFDMSQRLVSVTCPLPKDFAATINQLSKWAVWSGGGDGGA